MRQKQILKRKARNLLIDCLRRSLPTATDEYGNPGFRFEVAYDSDKVDSILNESESPLMGPDLSWESLDPEAMHAALRGRFTQEQIRLFELSVTGASSEAIGQKLALAATTVRKRWERLRPPSPTASLR